jgi:hypothetical protein
MTQQNAQKTHICKESAAFVHRQRKVILTEGSDATGAQRPRTASHQRSRYRFQVAASILVRSSPKTEAKSEPLGAGVTPAEAGTGSESP